MPTDTQDGPFFLVWSPTGERPPRYRHATRSAALKEAKRLARTNRGAEFYVLCATDRTVVDDIKHDLLVLPHDPNNIPF